MCAPHKCLCYSLEKWGRRELGLLPQTKVCSLTSGERISQINLNSIKTIAASFCYGQEGSQLLFPSLACSHCKDKSSFSSAKINLGDKMNCLKIKFAGNSTLALLLLSFLPNENSALVLGTDSQKETKQFSIRNRPEENTKYLQFSEVFRLELSLKIKIIFIRHR